MKKLVEIEFQRAFFMLFCYAILHNGNTWHFSHKVHSGYAVLLQNIHFSVQAAKGTVLSVCREIAQQPHRNHRRRVFLHRIEDEPSQITGVEISSHVQTFFQDIASKGGITCGNIPAAPAAKI